MACFKIKVGNLLEGLKRITLKTSATAKPTQLIKEAVVEISNGEVIIYGADNVLKAFAVKEIIKKDVEVLEEGQLVFSDLERIIDLLKTFSTLETVKIYEEENMLVMERELPYRKVIKLPITSKEFIDEIYSVAKNVFGSIQDYKEENYTLKKYKDKELCAYFKTDASYLEKAISTASKFMEKEVIIPFKLDEATLTVSVGNKVFGFVDEQIPLLSHYGSATARYQLGIDKLFSLLKGEVECWFNNDSPMIVRQVTKDYEVEYLIAPIGE